MAYNSKGGMDQATMHRQDGSYDFKRREDWGYAHTFEYMAGWLGESEAIAEKKRKKKLGNIDLTPPPLPTDMAQVELIEKTAQHIHKAKESEVFERLIQDKNKGKDGWGFLTETGYGHDYYLFCRHCLSREVDPRPLAEKARRVKDDREVKQANTKNNVFAAGGPASSSAAAAPKREARFKKGELMEVLGIKAKADYNGQIVRILSYDSKGDRYEVKFEGGRYDTVVVKLREENMMHTMVEEAQVKENKESTPEGEIPNGTKVEIRGLQAESAKWLNGQKGIVVSWDKDTERYEVRLALNNDVKKVKAGNVKIELPEGWEEHWDEHLNRHYYINSKTEKVTWKHPTVANIRGKLGRVVENNAEELAEVEIDHDRKHYDVDDEEELEGGFNLKELVKKVEEKELKRLAAEERGEEFDDNDSDDGMHRVSKKRKKKDKKKKDITVEQLQVMVASLVQETMVTRETMRKDFTLLEGNFVARELDPLLEQFKADPENPTDSLMRGVFETTLGLLEKGTSLMTQLRQNKIMAGEVHKRIQLLANLETPAELLEVAMWVSTLLKTM